MELTSEESKTDALDYAYFLQYDYALIDVLQVAPSQYEDLTSVRLVSDRMRRHTRMMPLLVSLKDRNVYEQMQLMDRSQRWQREYGKPLFAALLNAGGAALPKLRYHWQEQAIHWHSGKQRQVWLRLHDPRVFGHLSWIASEEQLAILMGPIQRWAYVDAWSGHWRDVARAQEPQDSRVTWRDEQWKLLDDLENINLCLTKLVHEYDVVIDSSHSVAKSIAGLLQDASRIGLNRDEDRQLYAELCIQHGSDIHQYEPLRSCVASAVSQGGGYIERYTAQASDQTFMQRIREKIG